MYPKRVPRVQIPLSPPFFVAAFSKSPTDCQGRVRDYAFLARSALLFCGLSDLPSIMSKLSDRKMVVAGVIFSALLNASGQILFKAARAAQAEASLLSLLTTPATWAGLAVYGFSAVCWLWVLSRAPLSFAYPILSLTFPIVVGASAILFSELILPVRWLGVGMIVLGVSLLAKT
jgi:undecaprenyl phosphate-alpha-L-ara4N flippase subunit ArnF